MPKEVEAADRILMTPIIEEGPKKGVLRRPERRTVILAGYVGHSLGHGGEFEGRQVIWFIENDEAGAAIWARIKEVLKDLELTYTDDNAEAWRFLGRS